MIGVHGRAQSTEPTIESHFPREVTSDELALKPLTALSFSLT